MVGPADFACMASLVQDRVKGFFEYSPTACGPSGRRPALPLLEDRTRLIQEKASGVDGAAVVESVHRDIRRLGGVRPPREFVFMDRAAIGLGSVFLHLKAEINWYRLFHELIEDFDEAELAARQRTALQAAGVPAGGRTARKQ